MKSWHPKSLNVIYYHKWQNKAKSTTLNSIRSKFIKKITASAEALDKSSATAWGPKKIPSNSIRDSFQRSAWEPYILGTGEKSHFSSSQESYIYTLITSFPKVLLIYHRKKTNRAVVHSWSNDVVVKMLDSQSRGPMFKSTGRLQGRLSLSSFRGR